MRTPNEILVDAQKILDEAERQTYFNVFAIVFVVAFVAGLILL